MYKARTELESYLQERFTYFALHNDEAQKIAKQLKDKYNIAPSVTLDMITRKLLADKKEFHLFCILEAIAEHNNEKELLQTYFTPLEIADYRQMKLEEFEFKFPIVIDCLQVANDQWIGCTDTNFFMNLRRAQKISYNERAQRVLTRKTIGGEERYEITSNETAIQEIQKSLHEGKYIPTTITLNIPYETDAKFVYNKDKKQLIIYSLEGGLDLSDGYHRFVAMGREKNVNPDFNAPWEIRIVNYMETKAQHFVYQESKKTQMKKLEAESMNAYSPANIVTNRLNGDNTFELFNEINNSSGKISFMHFVKCVNAFYFKDKKETSNAYINQVCREIKIKMNCLIQYNPSYLDKRFTYAEVVALFYVIKNITDASKLGEQYQYLISKLDTIKSHRLKEEAAIGNVLINDFDRILKEVQ